MPRNKQHIEIYDTTLRDGAQAQNISLSLQDKLMLSAKLDELGVDYIEGGYPLSNIKDASFFKEVKKLKLKNSKIAAFGMTRKKGIKAEKDEGMKALLAARTEVITIVGKTWDL
ncbi:MAG: beta/alpha barrel domain-containing protein, partial [Planctomycetota bacterium]